jgi:hypothetical protein
MSKLAMIANFCQMLAQETLAPWAIEINKNKLYLA